MRGPDDLRPDRGPRALTGRPARPPAGPLSLARALSKFGVCSRTEAVRRIEAGRVSVNGRVARSPRRRIDPARDRVEVDGARVRDLREHVVIVLHKPEGYVTTRHEPGGRPTVYDLLDTVGEWVFPVGRLDRDTSGLLIFTNDHRLGQELTDPASHAPRTYHARVRGLPAEDALRVLREGAVLEDGTRCRPAAVRALGGTAKGAWLEIVLTEGKNRQVRRMCTSIGHEVLELSRVSIGGLALGELARGSWRRLDAEEIALLRRR